MNFGVNAGHASDLLVAKLTKEWYSWRVEEFMNPAQWAIAFSTKLVGNFFKKIRSGSSV
jgi:hypothetical protein